MIICGALVLRKMRAHPFTEPDLEPGEKEPSGIPPDAARRRRRRRRGKAKAGDRHHWSTHRQTRPRQLRAAKAGGPAIQSAIRPGKQAEVAYPKAGEELPVIARRKPADQRQRSRVRPAIHSKLTYSSRIRHGPAPVTSGRRRRNDV